MLCVRLGVPPKKYVKDLTLSNPASGLYLMFLYLQLPATSSSVASLYFVSSLDLETSYVFLLSEFAAGDTDMWILKLCE